MDRGQEPLRRLLSGVLLSGCAAEGPILDTRLGFDMVAWHARDFTDGLTTRTLHEVAGTGADTVGIVVTAYVETCTSSTVTLSSHSTPSMDAVTDAVDDAHAAGLDVVVLPHLEVHADAGGCWRGTLAPTDRDAFWASYTAFVVDLAEASADVEILSVGTELSSLEDDRRAWRDLIDAVRATTEATLTYGANWDRVSAVPFWDRLDLVGVDGWWPLSGRDDPSEDALRRAWRRHADTMAAVHDDTGLPVLLAEVGLRSVHGAAERPWDCEIGGRRDEALQARAYATALDVWTREPFVEGLLFWNWLAEPDTPGCSGEYSPQDKGALDVFTRFARRHR